MPSTVNGIGTWYYGKAHLVTRHDQCEFCSSYEQLLSYDTTLYFVVVFIPIIPLGKKRIIDECPRCRRHRAAKLGEWERRKDEAILEATQAWQQDRASKDKAVAALGTAIGYHDAESFHQLAGPVGDAFARDADVQMFLGEAYDRYEQPPEAEARYRAALAARDDENTRQELAKFYLRRTRPADAEPLLGHILANKVRPKAMLLLSLAESYQAAGDHESAWRIVDDVGTAFPDLLSDPNYEKIRRSVSKYRGTSKAIRASHMDQRDGLRHTSWLTRHMGLVIAGTVVLVAAIWYLGLAWSLGKHTVSLVNGTPSTYTADINGKRYTIPAMSRVPADIREGTLKISIPASNGQIAPATVEMRTNFWRRPWNRRTMVINPDATAIVFWEETQYSNTLDENYESPHRFYAGEVLYNLDKVDYLFSDFPQKIQLPEKSKVVTKSRIDMAHDDGNAMALLATQFPPERQIELLRRHLGDRPIRVQLHRAYQGVVEKHQPDHDVIGEYRALLAKNPDDATLMYLVGRAVDDREEATALFRKAADAPQPSAYASFALSYDAMNSAEFAEALKRAQQARKAEPDNQMFIDAELDALEALGRYDEALALFRAEQAKSPDGARHQITEELRLIASKPDLPEAQRRIDQFTKDLASVASAQPEMITRIRAPLEAVVRYAGGDMPGWRKAIAMRTGPDAALVIALDKGKAEPAKAAIAQVTPATAGEHLLVYVVAKRSGRNDIADAMWARAVELLGKSHRGDQLFAKALAGNDPPSEKALRDWATGPTERCIVLTALGVRYPQNQARYFAEAKKLNYSRRYPQRMIDEVISK